MLNPDDGKTIEKPENSPLPLKKETPQSEFSSNLSKEQKQTLDLSETEFLPRKHFDSTSLITSSGDESENSNDRLNRRYDIDFEDFRSNRHKSKSTKSVKSRLKKSFTFDTVAEEKIEDDTELIKSTTVPRLKKIFKEMYDNLEDSLICSEKKKRKKITKCLSMMDPVVEEKEDIDFNHIRDSSFYKLEIDEEVKIQPSFYLQKDFLLQETIEEDYMENEPDIEPKRFARIKSEFIDRTERIDEYNPHGSIITDTIKEEPIHEDETNEIYINSKSECKLIYLSADLR